MPTIDLRDITSSKFSLNRGVKYLFYCLTLSLLGCETPQEKSDLEDESPFDVYDQSYSESDFEGPLETLLDGFTDVDYEPLHDLSGNLEPDALIDLGRPDQSVEYDFGEISLDQELSDLDMAQLDQELMARLDISEWQHAHCGHDQAQLEGRCPELIDAFHWTPVWDSEVDGQPCELPWIHEAEGEDYVECRDNVTTIPSISLSRWFFNRQREEQSQGSLTLPMALPSSSWSIHLSIMITQADVPQVDQGQAFFYLGLIDQGEQPGTGYPGSSTGLYLQPHTPPRLYDRGRAGPNAGQLLIRLNQRYHYTIVATEGELWVRLGEEWISRVPLRTGEDEPQRQLSALRLSCVHCQADVHVKEVLSGEAVALLPPSSFRDGDGSDCHQVIKNARFDYSVDRLPHRWVASPPPSLELDRQRWVEGMSTVGLRMEEGSHTLQLHPLVAMSSVVTLPEGSCRGMLLSLHGAQGEQRAELLSHQSQGCDQGEEGSLGCRLTLLEEGIYLAQGCPTGLAELKLWGEGQDESSIRGVALTPLSLPLDEEGNISSEEPLPLTADLPCDPSRHLDARRVDTESLASQGFGLCQSLAMEPQPISLQPLDDSSGHQSSPQVTVQSSDESLQLMLNTRELDRVKGALRLSLHGDPISLEWSRDEGLDLNTVWRVDEEQCEEEECRLTFVLDWRSLPPEVIGAELFLTLDLALISGEHFGISPALYSPHGMRWGGALASVRLMAFPNEAIAHEMQRFDELPTVDTSLKIAPVIPMRRGEHYIENELGLLLNDLGFQGLSIGNPHKNWVPTAVDLSRDLGLFLDFNLFYGVNFWRDGDLRSVYLEIAQSLGQAISLFEESSERFALTLLDEPLIHPIRRCVDDLSTVQDLSTLKLPLLEEVQRRCSAQVCTRGEALTACRASWSRLIILLAKDVAVSLGEARDQVEIGINLTGDLGLSLATELAQLSALELDSPLDQLSFTNNWVGYHEPLSWSLSTSQVMEDIKELDARIQSVAYSLFSGPNGAWGVKRAPSVKEARAMSILLFAFGNLWQRVFAWPPAHLDLAFGLGRLNQELESVSRLLRGQRVKLPTSESSLYALWLSAGGEDALLIVNRSSRPLIGSILCPESLTGQLQRSELRRLLTAEVNEGDIDQEAGNTQVTPEEARLHFERRLSDDTRSSLTVNMKGWDAILYGLSPVD